MYNTCNTIMYIHIRSEASERERDIKKANNRYKYTAKY